MADLAEKTTADEGAVVHRALLLLSGATGIERIADNVKRSDDLPDSPPYPKVSSKRQVGTAFA